MTQAQLAEIHSGRRIASDENVVWQGRPAAWSLMLRVFHLRIIVTYFLLVECIAFGLAGFAHLSLHILAPLGPTLVTVAMIAVFSFAIQRSTTYLITTRRVIIRYGVVFPRSLSLPFSQIASMAVAVRSDQSGDIALTLRAPNHMPYLKLWPHARAWHRRPQPMLRDVAHAGRVATHLAQLLNAANLSRAETCEPVTAFKLSA